MSNDETKSDSNKNTNSSQKNTTQTSTNLSKDEIISNFENDLKILEEKNKAKDQEIAEIKEKTTKAIIKIKEDAKSEPEIKTNLVAGIIKQNTFKGGFKNGYADGTVKAARKEIRKTQRKASVQSK